MWTVPDPPSRRRELGLIRRGEELPPLRFSPAAWSQLLCLRDAGPTEIGGFGICPAGDLLCVEELRLVRQVCTEMSVQFDDAAVAELFDEQIDRGRRPEQFARVWVHTHPGDSPLPSGVDEETFARVFGRCDWSVMFILARGGRSYARLQYRVGPGAALRIPVVIDWSRPCGGPNQTAWEAEYVRCVTPVVAFRPAAESDVAAPALLAGAPSQELKSSARWDELCRDPFFTQELFDDGPV